MRIAQVNLARDWGGAERHVALLSHGLRVCGEDVVVCCHPGAGLFRCAQSRQLAYRTVAVANQLDLIASLRIAGQLRRFCPEIIHLHTPRDYVCGFLASRLLPNANLVLTRHTMRPVKPIMRQIYGKASAVFCLSEGISDYMKQQGVPAGLLRRARSGVETADYGTQRARLRRDSLRCEWGADPEQIVFAAIGRLVPEKGHICLLEALALANNACGNLGGQGLAIKLVFVGDGPEQPRLEQEARALGLSRSTHFAGYLGDIPAVLAAIDVFVLASEREMLPLSVMEAMAAGVPVVATSVGGVTELVEPEGTGLLAPPRDPPRLAEHLLRLARSASLRAQFGARAAERAHRDFTLEAMASDAIAVYRELAAGC